MLLALGAIEAPAAVLQAGAPATVRVQVVAGSGEPVAAQAVVLEVADGQRLVERLEATTGDDGIAVFEPVASGPAHNVRALVRYAGAEYGAEPRPVSAGEELLVPVTVWPTASQGMPMHLDMLHIVVIAIEPGLWEVAEVMTVRNVGAAAWVGGPAAADGRATGLVVPLPEGALRVDTPPGSGLDPTALILEDGQLLHARPVPPGVHQAAVTYELVAGEEGRTISLSLPYPTQRVGLLIGGPAMAELSVEAADFVEGEPVEIPGRGTFAQWNREVIAAGDTISFALRPAGAALSARFWALLGAGIALAVAVGASLLGPLRPPRTDEERQRLLEQIARLDIEREAGRLDDGQYFQRRGAALEQLILLGETPGSSPDADLEDSDFEADAEPSPARGTGSRRGAA